MENWFSRFASMVCLIFQLTYFFCWIQLQKLLCWLEQLFIAQELPSVSGPGCHQWGKMRWWSRWTRTSGGLVSTLGSTSAPSCLRSLFFSFLIDHSVLSNLCSLFCICMYKLRCLKNLKTHFVLYPFFRPGKNTPTIKSGGDWVSNYF